MAASDKYTTMMIEGLANHITLPPQLPGRKDAWLSQIDAGLLVYLLDSLLKFGPSGHYDVLRRALRSSKVVNAGGRLEKGTLLAAFLQLQDGEFLIVHVEEQNCGLVVRRDHEDHLNTVLFEAFELSARAKDVLASKNALQWSFPGTAVALSVAKYNEPSFQAELATFLEKASMESIKRFAAHASKAGSSVYECRDTPSPELITQMLMTLLEVNGTRVFPPLLRKRVRDDVCWGGAESPWRRSPFWLLLRVAVQRHLATLHGGEDGRVIYKFLMCLVHVRILDEALPHLMPEIIVHIKSKLCRRLSKLEVERQRARSASPVHDTFFLNLRGIFYKSISTATERLNNDWTRIKKTMLRQVLTLPKKADDRHLYLTLPNSGSYIRRILDYPVHTTRPHLQGFAPKPSFGVPKDYDASLNDAKPMIKFSQRHYSLSETELEVELSMSRFAPLSYTECEGRCEQLADAIEKYLDASSEAYNSDPEQKSIMLLTVMDMWMVMDKCAVKVYPLLRDYGPQFSAKMMEILRLPSKLDIERLHSIRDYIHERTLVSKASGRTIFDKPQAGCFAERYYNESSNFELQDLHQEIEEEAEDARSEKEEEWEKQSEEYEKLVKKASEATCVFTIDEFEQKVHNERGCTKCFLERKCRRFKIKAHEYPLPSDPILAKIVVFELRCPKAFSAYRATTWRILSTLALPAQEESNVPHVLLQDYSELKPYARSINSRFTLGSATKSFLVTHYSHPRLPAPLSDICLPNGLRLHYYDTVSKIWPAKSLQKPSFAEHCPLQIPTSSPFASLLSQPEFAIEAKGPTSYQIIASQTKCPSGVNVHEWTAYQTLLSGTTRRWHQILAELGGSSLNFGTEATTILMGHLASQAGPEGKYHVGVMHEAFQDEIFCLQLASQIDQRLDSISSNYRETNSMETLITFILKLKAFAIYASPEAVALLLKARNITANWIKVLLSELRGATDADVSRRYSRYVLWSSLLCRRTFSQIYNKGELLCDELMCFIKASIAMQDNMASDPTKVPMLLRNALVRDLKSTYRIRHVLQHALESKPETLISSISAIWPETEGNSSRSFSPLVFLPTPNTWWVQITASATSRTNEQTVHFHLLEGHLLVMSKPVGKLPVEHRTAPVLLQLFPNQTLLTYPSSLPGMLYMLAIPYYSHQIHIGFRNGVLFVRALVRNRILELIPYTEFGKSQKPSDLPKPMIADCAHWLDINTGVIEIRNLVWRSRPKDWKIDFYRRRATRGASTLVDPHSALFSRVANILSGFELRHELVVFMPKTKTMTVELRRLELSFFVNGRNLLESPQLRSEIIQDQDAGTWYGLDAMIVLQEVIPRRNKDTNREEPSVPGTYKSIIVPMGDMTQKRCGAHVRVSVANNRDYARYHINEVLKRLDCPAEPRLLYLKAQYHAYTSFVIPDTLTGRTGTEEAIHCLTSGYCQPWAPLTPGPSIALRYIAKLTPKREYYPKDLKNMQSTIWDPQLTATIQFDGFRSIIENIQRKSDLLSIFALNAAKIEPLEPLGEAHLTSRSLFRRSLYQRLNSSFHGEIFPDRVYQSRDGPQRSDLCRNVFETGYLIQNWSSKFETTSDLAGIMQQWPLIGGYVESFDKILLSDLLELDVALAWGSLASFCISSDVRSANSLMFLLGTISYQHNLSIGVVRSLIAFAIWGKLKAIVPPEWAIYHEFQHNQVPRLDSLVPLMATCLELYPGDERETFGFALSYKQRKKFEAMEVAHERQQKTDASLLATFLLNQWPCKEPSIEGFESSVIVDVQKALEIIRPEWLRLFQNFELSNYLGLVQSVLDDARSDELTNYPPLEVVQQDVFPSRIRGREVPCLQKDLLSKDGIGEQLPLLLTNSAKTSQLSVQSKVFAPKGPNSVNVFTKQKFSTVNQKLENEIRQLQTTFDGLMKSTSNVQQQYGKDLISSLDALRQNKQMIKSVYSDVNLAELPGRIALARRALRLSLESLSTAFASEDPRMLWLQLGGLWPCITPVTLLENLRSTSNLTFGNNMKEMLIKYAHSLAALQRLLRLEDARAKANTQKIHDEHHNPGHTTWDPRENPDWLLLEIDANITLREIQVTVANATILPESRSNSVLQMNMGEGKTSCIMPMAAAVLANGKNLHRVIIPKPLLLQTANTLQGRLGGLVGREIRHVPFSRKTPTDSQTTAAFFQIHEETRKSSGVILALPEHLLSFFLSGVQRLSDDRINESKSMIKIQDWLNKNSRDVLDECDNILAIKTQLIYPSGSQKILDGHPQRWEVVETLLGRVNGHLWNLQKAFPHSLEVVRRFEGAFPVAFFLRQDVEKELISRLVDDISKLRTNILPADCPKSDRQAIKQFISEPKVSSQVLEKIKRLYPEKPAIKQAIYLVRGLLVHRILLMVLKKRWNVQYGLNPDRDPIAVPFMAKGTPSEQAEWGHPDVMVTMTCLAFYYEGLSPTQLRQTLEHVLKSDDPTQAYDRFSQQSKLPDSLRDWNAINVDDEAQVKEIWQYIRYDIAVIDYFMNNFVFPRHAKQFQMKLQASGWDLPLFSPDASSDNERLTTGFSGTNDWKRILPLTIEQHDLPALSPTNAQVLAHLLEPRNRMYVVACDARGRHISEYGLLRRLYDRRIRVLIDAGAQILEMSNLALCKAWLEISEHSPAAVYFDESNKPYVIYRHGHRTPLLASPYADDLGECLVYLDEAHTRGTDLKIPKDAIGALTLGLGQTKDHTVQAAMRLRQLGTTQSVVFFAPPEVHQSILDLRKKKQFDRIDSLDVISWLLEQTCNGIEQLQPLYFSQGADFCRRLQASVDNPNFFSNVAHREAYLRTVRTIEQQTLEQLYGVHGKSKIKLAPIKYSSNIATFMKELTVRRKGFQDTGHAVHGSALQEVEQEREVAYEVEAVREVQKPISYSPYGFSGLHRDIESFARVGRLPAGSAAVFEAFAFIGSTSIGRKHGIDTSATSGKLFVSRQFTRTINPPKDRPYDQFQRPVNWILWSEVSQVALIVIPEEAELLLTLIADLQYRPTFLLLYAAPVTRKMLQFNNLDYCFTPPLRENLQIPMWFRIELGIFAGRLYFDFFEYSSLLEFLGTTKRVEIADVDDEDIEDPLVDGGLDGGTVLALEGVNAIEQNPDSQPKPRTSFTRKPLHFLQEWLAMRRKGQDCAQTPMGFVCQDKPLLESHPFFGRVAQDTADPEYVKRSNAPGVSEEEDDAEGDYGEDETYGIEVDADEADNFDDNDLVSEEGEPFTGTSSSESEQL